MSGPDVGNNLLELAEQAEQNLSAAAGGGSLPGLSPAGTESAAEIDQQAQVLGEAGVIVEMLAGALHMLFPVLDYTAEIKQESAQKMAPLLQKYGGNAGWLARWKEEIDAGMFFAGVAFSSWQLVKAEKAKAAAKVAGGDGESGD